MLKKILCSTLLALPLFAGASIAQAADVIVEAPPAPAPIVAEPPGFWHGFYIGALVGYHWENVDGIPGNGNGASVGGYIGGNYRFNNNLVIGVEGDYNAAFGGGWPDLGGELTQFGTIRGRVGYAMDRWLIYAAGGVAFSTFEPAFGNSGPDVSETGWTLGGGAEYMITDHISLRGEYLYMQFDDSFEDLGAPPGITTDVQNVRFGIGYNF